MATRGPNRFNAIRAVAVGVAGFGLTAGGLSMAIADDGPDSSAGTEQSGKGWAAVMGHEGPGLAGLLSKSDVDIAGIAKQLGVSEQQLVTAAQKVFADRFADGHGWERFGGSHGVDFDDLVGSLAGDLADELSIPKSHVLAVYEDLCEKGEAEHRKELAKELDDAVAKGQLTRRDVASVLKAYDADIVDGPGF